MFAVETALDETMVLGPRSKTHKSPSSLQLDYTIHILEVKPWPPSQSLSTLRSALIQWELRGRASGFTNHAVPSGSGRIEFNESFRLRLRDGNTYQRNYCIEFNLYEPRRDKGGQLLGTAVLDLAACGVIKESVSISTPMNCRRTYRNSPQPLLFLKIQPFIIDRAEEAEVASSTTDDDVSSRSSLAVASSTADSNGSSSPLSKKYVEEEGLEVENSVESGKRRNHNSLVTATSRGSISSERKEATASRKETTNLFSQGCIQNLEQRIQILEGELREAAALELSLYSVSAQHESSMNKVHAPARRLLRLYFHADKQNPRLGRASASKSIVSGLILVAKACGNDVPRLTFWLSNTIILRAIISKSFGDRQLPNRVRHDIGKAHKKNGKKKPSPFTGESFSSKVTRSANKNIADEREKPLGFVAELEKVEAWIFSRIIESLWWQTFTPHMQSRAAKAIRKVVNSGTSKSFRRTSSSVEQQEQNFSLELWKKAFKDACERICPVRGGGHDCGCSPLLSEVIMKQLVARLDVAMFNAILRESADEMPTDPVSDPISDADVLPIPAGKASFGAGVLLKNAIGNWSRWLTDLFGMDDEDALEPDDGKELRSWKAFCLLNELSDLMMLPKELLLSPSIRKEACPTFGLPVLGRILKCFVPDEFCPDPIPGAVVEALNSEDWEEDSIPCEAAAAVYESPSADSVARIIGGIGGGSKLACSTSDDELDQLESPSILGRSLSTSTSTRYQLLGQLWKE